MISPVPFMMPKRAKRLGRLWRILASFGLPFQAMVVRFCVANVGSFEMTWQKSICKS
jgi:hypothetical protein